MNDLNSYFSNKKTIVSFVLSIFVFLIHFRAFSVFDNVNGTIELVFNILLTVTKVAVPLFFLISAVLYYRNYKLETTFYKWKSRFYSLCIPYLIWNTIWLILALLGNYTPLGNVLGGLKATLSVENVMRGIFLYGYFEPFWFMFQLIVLIIICPIIYIVLKNKWIGLICIISYFLFNCFGFRLNEVLFPSSDMVLIYLIGAWIGIHNIEIFTVRKKRKQCFLCMFLFLGCCIYYGTINILPKWCSFTQIRLLVIIMSCFSFWGLFDYFDMNNCPKYTTNSFLIYALHSFIGASISKILFMIFPSGQIYLAMIASITFILTIVIICYFGYLLKRYFPVINKILVGR